MFKKFGFSGKSDFFLRLGDKLSKGIFILLAAVGTVLLSISGAFAGNFDFYIGFAETQGVLSTALFLIVNPYTGLGAGALFLLQGLMEPIRINTSRV